ncbi:hypothetical protein [Actinacidiphila acidipaludis]|uniref:Uncharacterized protein n=1 Tax=Actinacidiphila acidipaludis TaxID=2873382 RepID=A0ABS7QHF8_9ACTN|nr:hypothetical protein [Streptomyces acidipaludis]MBY8882393.1 hypothetical protein [Streptomyces acidipaludis]
MGDIRGWPDRPEGVHQPKERAGRVDGCLNCCAAALVAVLLGVCLCGYWLAHATIRIPF